MRERPAGLRTVADLARAVQGAEGIAGVLDAFCASIVSLGAERAVAGRYLADAEVFAPGAAALVADDDLDGGPVRLAEQPLLRLAVDGRRVAVSERREDASALQGRVERPHRPRTAVAVPLLAAGEPGQCLGLLLADGESGSLAVDAEAVELLTALAAVAAAVLEKAIAHDQLRRVDQLKSSFIALASHELRSPAAVIHGVASTLELRGDTLHDDQKALLRRTLYEHTERMRRLVDQLLDLSRLDAPDVGVRPQRFRVRPRVAELVAAVAPDHAGEFVLDVDGELETVTDPGAFDRILANLIANACRYGAPPFRVSARQPDAHFRVSVEDRGDGVPDEFVPRLFERFTRSDDSRQRAGGAGLGLAIASSYAHALGGELLYERAEPHGARFELVLRAPD